MDQETDEGVQRKTNVTRAGNLMMVWEKIAKSDVKLGYEENNEKAFGGRNFNTAKMFMDQRKNGCI